MITHYFVVVNKIFDFDAKDFCVARFAKSRYRHGVIAATASSPP